MTGFIDRWAYRLFGRPEARTFLDPRLGVLETTVQRPKPGTWCDWRGALRLKTQERVHQHELSTMLFLMERGETTGIMRPGAAARVAFAVFGARRGTGPQISCKSGQRVLQRVEILRDSPKQPRLAFGGRTGGHCRITHGSNVLLAPGPAIGHPVIAAASLSSPPV